MYPLIKSQPAGWRGVMKSANRKKFSLFILLLSGCAFSFAQVTEPGIINKDSATAIKKISPKKEKDTASVKIHSPKKAAIRSAILPGWGQVYNKKYWKVPIVYGLLGTLAGVYAYNLGNYRSTRFAYTVKYNMRVYHTDSAKYAQIKENLKPLSEESLRFYRNQFRRDVDYSALYFIIVWGLNVIDATVDAHLKSFDVSPDLSLQIKPGHSEIAGTNGISLVLKIR